MISRLHLGALILVVVVVFVGGIWLTGGEVSWGWFSLLGATITTVAVLLALFNLWIWRLNLLQGWFVKRPHLWGKWSVSIKPEWINPESGKKMEPIEASFAITQTYFGLHIRMESSQSSGELLHASLVAQDDGNFRVAGIYRNEPKLSERPKSAIHYGSFLLNVMGPPNSPTGMSGHYWTDRGTNGEMIAERGAK